MLKKMVLGIMNTNCYILSHDETNCIIIDPGHNGQKIAKYIDEKGYHVSAILLTHGHFDHIGAVDYLYERYHCQVYTHSDSIELCHNQKLNLSVYDKPMVVQSPLIPAPQAFNVAGFDIQWLLLEGHCQGSSMIYLPNEKMIFSGDVLFAGSIGRDDFPTSSHQQTKQTIQKIKSYDFDACVYPGHGEATTLKHEQQTNLYFR